VQAETAKVWKKDGEIHGIHGMDNAYIGGQTKVCVIEGTWIGIFARCFFFLGGSKQKPLDLGKIKHRWNAREMNGVVDDEW
jgi:hypothetical protein